VAWSCSRLSVALVLIGCSDSHQAEPSSLCAEATELREAAFAAAQRDAPECGSADDCAVLELTLECPQLLRLGDCGRAVHRDVAARYEQMAVTRSICRKLSGAEMGCSQGPVCAAVGPLQCVDGRCVQPLQ
jgi:hypothetical protein